MLRRNPVKTINSTDNLITLDRAVVNIFGYPVSLKIYTY